MKSFFLERKRGFQKRREALTYPVSKMSSRRAKLYSWSDTIPPCTKKHCGENPFDRSSPKYSRKEMEISILSSPLSTSLPNPRVPFLNGFRTLQRLTFLKKVSTFAPKGREIVRFDIEKKQTIRNSHAKILNTIPVKYLPKGFRKKCTDIESWERTEIQV